MQSSTPLSASSAAGTSTANTSVWMTCDKPKQKNPYPGAARGGVKKKSGLKKPLPGLRKGDKPKLPLKSKGYTVRVPPSLIIKKNSDRGTWETPGLAPFDPVGSCNSIKSVEKLDGRIRKTGAFIVPGGISARLTLSGPFPAAAPSVALFVLLYPFHALILSSIHYELLFLYRIYFLQY